MTQKEKLIKATKMAMMVKSIASNLRFDARDYNVWFPLEYAKRLEDAANEYLELIK